MRRDSTGVVPVARSVGVLRKQFLCTLRYCCLMLGLLVEASGPHPRRAHACRKLMTAASAQHAQECEQEHETEGLLMEELGRLLGEVKASARSAQALLLSLLLCCCCYCIRCCCYCICCCCCHCCSAAVAAARPIASDCQAAFLVRAWLVD